MKEKMYRIPESQLDRLLMVCSNANHCISNNKIRDHCSCKRLAGEIDEEVSSLPVDIEYNPLVP